MPSELRPTSPADAPALRALAELVLHVAPDSPMFTPDAMEWKYWARWASSAGARSLVLEREGAIVAHVGVLPVGVLAGGRPLTLLHPFDWMSAPGAVGSGAALLKRLTSLADGVLIVGGSDMTRRMVGPLGFRALGEVQRFAAPSTQGQLSAGPAGAVYPATPASVTDGACVLPAAPWLPFARSPERLLDLLRCPAARMAVYRAERGSTPLGGFVLAFAPAQARIVAFWPAQPDPGSHAHLLELARREASRHPGVSEIAAMAAEPTQQRALLAAGFDPAGSVPMFLSAAPECLPFDVRLAFQMVDGDVAFLHHGAPDPWSSSSGTP